MTTVQGIVSMKLPLETSKKNKVRNYSFEFSKRLPAERMTEINGLRIPSMPGSCYHAIICALAHHKDKFCSWDNIIELTEKYVKQYGGTKAWDKFKNKGNVKSYQQRIKDNTHTLTRTGKDCYGYRLHERGMAIYYFKDGAMLKTGGRLMMMNKHYNVIFPDGSALQVRYRGTTMTSKEFKKFLDAGLIDRSGKILDPNGVKRLRSSTSKLLPDITPKVVSVCVTLGPSFDQLTADRLHKLGLMVDEAHKNELIGTISSKKLKNLEKDPDVVEVESNDGRST